MWQHGPRRRLGSSASRAARRARTTAARCPLPVKTRARGLFCIIYNPGHAALPDPNNARSPSSAVASVESAAARCIASLASLISCASVALAWPRAVDAIFMPPRSFLRGESLTEYTRDVYRARVDGASARGWARHDERRAPPRREAVARRRGERVRVALAGLRGTPGRGRLATGGGVIFTRPCVFLV